MNIERTTVVDIAGTLLVDELSLSASEVILCMQDLINKYGESVFLDLNSEGCYSGYYEYNICIRRMQTDDEYNQMVMTIERQAKIDNDREVHRIIEKSIRGKSLTRKESSFLAKNGISLNR